MGNTLQVMTYLLTLCNAIFIIALTFEVDKIVKSL